MSRPLISVVLPTYNRASSLARALESLNRQEQVELEVLVVDNRSSDGTAELLSRLSEPFVALYEATPGESWARNTGVVRARSEWIAFFDDDEVAEPDWLWQLWRVAQTSGAAVVGGSVLLSLSASEHQQWGPQCRKFLGELLAEEAGASTLPGCCNALVHRRVFDQVGLFDTELTVASDSDFFLRAQRAGFRIGWAPRARVVQEVSAARCEPGFLRKRALWQGAYFALLMGEGSRRATLSIALSRLLKGFLVHAPLALVEAVRGRRGHSFGHQLLLYRAVGCVRSALAVWFPGLFHQAGFFEHLKNQARVRPEGISSR